MNIRALKKVQAAMNLNHSMIDMSTTGDPLCGTPGCIAGFIYGLFEKEHELKRGEGYYCFFEFLGVTPAKAFLLTLGMMSPFDIINLDITAEDAINAIDKFIEGETNIWPENVQKEVEQTLNLAGLSLNE